MDPELESLMHAALEGEVIAFLPLADALMDRNHPDGEELVSLAIMIAETDDWALATFAIACFVEILKKGQ